MSEVLKDVESWSARGEKVAVATVVAVKRSAPMPPGTKMAVSSSGAVVGAVSGGCVEGAVVEEALATIRDGKPRLLDFGVTDEQAWEVGLACGGKIEIFVERVE